MSDDGSGNRQDRPRGRGRQEQLDRAAEILVYAPLGLGAYVREVAPEVLATVVARGRAEADRRREEAVRQLNTVRSTGQVALHFGLPALLRGWRSRANERAGDIRRRIDGLGGLAGARRQLEDVRHRTEDLVASVTGRSNGATDHETSDDAVTRTAETGPAPTAPQARAGESAHLPIPGYDALSASQVVERLAGLGADDLAAVRAYEAAHRNRRTILGKIDQLSPPTPSAAPSSTSTTAPISSTS